MVRNELYSVRMHASAGDRHVSGAERIVPAGRVERTVSELSDRALEKENRPDRITVKIDRIDPAAIRYVTSLDLVTLDVPDAKAGRTSASRLLEHIGVSSPAVNEAIALLANGPAPSGKAMRGAMILDAVTSERLEPDRERGVRASRFDWSDEALADIDAALSLLGLTHYRTREALALATKVAHAPGIVAELCWSDDPDYNAGYISSLSTGYVRFPFLKRAGETCGGRAFFVRHDDFNIDSFFRYLQEDPVIITDIGTCSPAEAPDKYFEQHPRCS